ncbi:MAG: FtsQ-type POTRA domain-containing protein [Actinomycetales bacterium]|nr:FtsQ-type POTRA domain-containing protein [Actinomycetales bacterium]
MAGDRFTERAQSRKRRKRTWIISGVAIALVLGGVAWAAWSTSWLAVKQVDVVGLEHASEAEVLAAAQVPIGTPLLQVASADIEERVSQLRIVRDVMVEREFPNTIRVAVTERQAVAWLERGSTPWAVDSTGLAYRPLRKKPNHLPRLEVKTSDAKTIRAAAQVAADLAVVDPNIFGRLKSISAESQDSVELLLDGGKTVVWGDSGNAEQKVQTLNALLDVPARRYDVSAPERPTTEK